MQGSYPSLAQAFSLVSRPNNQTIKKGQLLLEGLKHSINYPIMLLDYIRQAQLDGKLKGAIELRLWCQSYKNMEQYEKRRYQKVMNNVKDKCVLGYLTQTLKISRLFRSGIVSLADVLFPLSWKNLIPNLLDYSCSNPDQMIRVLKLIQSITQKYTLQTRSKDIHFQMTQICDQVHSFLLQLAHILIQRCQTSQIIKLRLIMSIFYNLNCLYLHDHFTLTLPRWIYLLNTIIRLQTSHEEMFKCKGIALQSILLYASNYKHDVQSSIRQFSQNIWMLCCTVNEKEQYDFIILSALKYFQSLILWPQIKQFFSNNLQKLINTLILPNLKFNQRTLELFQLNSVEFIDFYFRNAQYQTRRSSAVQLLRTICRVFSTFQDFLVNYMRQILTLGPNHEQQILLIDLIIQSGSKGFSETFGTTQLSISKNIIAYAYEQVIKPAFLLIYQDLQRYDTIQTSFQPAYVSGILRFIFYYRIFIPQNQLPSILGLLLKIKTQNQTLQNIVYISINAILTVKYGNYIDVQNLISYFSFQNLKPYLIDLFKMIGSSDARYKTLHYQVICILFSLCNILGNNCINYYEYLQKIIKQMLAKTNQYQFKNALKLFQTIGVIYFNLLQKTCRQAELLSNIIYQSLKICFQKKSDILNFYLQLFAIQLHFNSSLNSCQEIYQYILHQNCLNNNFSSISSQILYLTTFLKYRSERIQQDMKCLCIILQRTIQIEHYSVFYRLIEAILKFIGLDAFYNLGYLRLALLKTQVIIQKSPNQRKNIMIFILKLTYESDTKKAITYINYLFPNYLESILDQGKDIIETIQLNPDRKTLFRCLCQIISSKQQIYNHRSPILDEIQGAIFNRLITNSANRFKTNTQRLAQDIKERQNQVKKEGSFQKLMILNSIEMKVNYPEKIFQENVLLLEAYFSLRQNKPSTLDFLTPENLEKIQQLIH